MHLPNPSCQSNLVGVSFPPFFTKFSDTYIRTSLFQSLHNLGLSHVLNMYLTGVGVASPQSMLGLSRFQYEAAWRCSLWEDQHVR